VPTDLTRAISAFLALTRETTARQHDRQRLRDTSDQVALLLVQHLRVGDTATTPQATYQLQQVTWPIDLAGGTTKPTPTAPAPCSATTKPSSSPNATAVAAP